MEHVVGVALGVLGSLIAWSILFWGLSPRLRFADAIRKRVYEADGSFNRYSLRVRNSGLRSAVDLDINASVHIRGLANQPNLWTAFTVTVRRPRVALLMRGKNLSITFIPRALRDAELVVEYHDQFEQSILNTKNPLEEMLRAGNRAHMRITILAQDSFSGSRRVYLSRDFVLDDVRVGKYAALKLIPLVNLP